MTSRGEALVRGELCDRAVFPPGRGQPAALRARSGRAAGLAADRRPPGRAPTISATSCCRRIRIRSRRDRNMIADGEAILEAGLRRAGQDATSCTRRSAPATRPRPAPRRPTGSRSRCSTASGSAMSRPRWWRPTAVAVAMAERPAAGLVILDALAHHPQLRRWAQLYIARAELLRCLGRDGEATDAYRSALELEPAAASRSFIARRLRELRSGVNGGRDLRLCRHREGWRGRST